MTLRLPKGIRDKFDRWAKNQGLDRSAALRELIEQALAKRK
jgi:predicted DNA-binding protein